MRPHPIRQPMMDLLLSESTWRAAALLGLADGLKLEGRIGRPVAPVEKQLMAILQQPDPSVQDAAIEVTQYFELRGLIEKAVAEAADEELAVDDRISALRVLRGASFAMVQPVLHSILTSPSPQDLQQAAARTAASFTDSGVGEPSSRDGRATAPKYAQASSRRCSPGVRTSRHFLMPSSWDELKSERWTP